MKILASQEQNNLKEEYEIKNNLQKNPNLKLKKWRK